MIRLAIAGATGRTGGRVLELAAGDARFTTEAPLESPDCLPAGSTIRVADKDITIFNTLDKPCDVLIDFTTAEGTMTWLDVCRQRGISMVIGSTGHDDAQLAQIREAGKVIPIVKATNFSAGVQAVINAARRVVNELGDAYDIEIIETHHRHKMDAPSGTALTLADEIAAACGRSRDDIIFGRQGVTGERPVKQIAVHAVRMGEVVGQHEIHFSGPGETVTIRHVAHSRDTFAAGALRAAAWIVDRPPALYAMKDVMD